jgi:RNA-directed DNA polymerase
MSSVQMGKGVALLCKNLGKHHRLNLDTDQEVKEMMATKLSFISKQRISDEKFLCYIVRMLKSGIMEVRNYYATEKGTPQGGVASPILANIYLHYLQDLWFIRDILPNCRGQAQIIRYCDDFVICVEREDDARELLEQLEQRLGKGKLRLSLEKTRIIKFRRPSGSNSDSDTNSKSNSDEGKKGGKPGTFNFLGFTRYWEKSRKGLQEPGDGALLFDFFLPSAQ